MRLTLKSMESTTKKGKISLETQRRLLGGDGSFKKKFARTIFFKKKIKIFN